MDLELAPSEEEIPAKKAKLPQKKFYRQRAHANPNANHEFLEVPITPDEVDWSEEYPILASPTESDGTGEKTQRRVEFLDVGCGYGGLLVTLSPLFPETLMLGMELRVKVSQYVKDKIVALRELHPGQYNNIACVRTNAMKFLPNYFHKGQLTKMFFLYPDPHFKRCKHKWRIINQTLLSEYAFFLGIGGFLYTVTDVKDMHEWMVDHLTKHPLFEEVTQEELKLDIVAQHIMDCTEEGQKVTRNKGDKFMKVFRRIEAGIKPWNPPVRFVGSGEPTGEEWETIVFDLSTVPVQEPRKELTQAEKEIFNLENL